MTNSSDTTDTELVHNVQNGDMESFRALVSLYKDKSLSLAISIVKDNVLAEDVLQEAFIKVYKNINKFKFKSKFSTWLYRIVVNTSYNELKKQKRNVSIEEYTTILNKSATEKEDQYLSSKDQKEYILEAMKQLKSDEALVLRLFYLCEMNLKEIQVISGFNASKVRVTLHRGRKNIKLKLEKLLGKEMYDLL